jgi:hypothetical protein
MSLRLEELRRRLLQPGPSTPPTYSALRRDPSGHSNPSYESPTGPRNGSETGEDVSASMTQEDPIAQSSSQAGPLNEMARPQTRREAAGENTPGQDDLAEAVAKLFEPSRRCQELLAEIASSSASVAELARSTAEVYEPLKGFRDHIRRLAASYGSMRAFQDELGALAESFEPVRVLHEKIMQLADAVRAHLADLATSLGPAAKLRAETANLAAILDSVSELQTQFFDLSNSFGPTASNGADSGSAHREVA